MSELIRIKRELHEVQRELRYLRSQLGQIPLNGGIGGSASYKPPVVDELPPLPDDPTWVWLTQPEGGTEKPQIWSAGPGSDRWGPETYMTAIEGNPGDPST